MSWVLVVGRQLSGRQMKDGWVEPYKHHCIASTGRNTKTMANTNINIVKDSLTTDGSRSRLFRVCK